MTATEMSALDEAFTKFDDAFDSLDAGMTAVHRAFEEAQKEDDRGQR